MLDRHLCQVGGLNQNYVSAAGTLYHVQIEDRGPVLDRISEKEVRRVNLVVYANYGEPNARIVHASDHDSEDQRSHEHNRRIETKIQKLASEARTIIEEKEQRQVMRIKCLIREYHHTKDETAKREFEEANALYPFLFSRAWFELKQERARAAGPALLETVSPAGPAAPAEAQPDPSPEEVLYPLDADLRELVVDIERIIIELGQDLQRLRTHDHVDDILLQTCRKLVTRAREILSGREPSEFSARRLDMTRNGLMTTWRQVRSRLRA
jgi:hypothetical protein